MWLGAISLGVVNLGAFKSGRHEFGYHKFESCMLGAQFGSTCSGVVIRLSAIS